MKDVASRLAERGIALTVEDSTLDYILPESYDPEEIDVNSTVYIDAPNGSELVYQIEKNEGLVNAETGQKADELI
ncbi:hypothetical protein J1N35_008601 [Gossypium stocksii]|uniref:Uncharacterized protein n=1 Tax=Gossypium stocksii TaxID=47602 RepID=A0A9D3W9L1_9ROSI|nr:hypothetical protein J1N35_008601 [Gossypium stocksii]